MSKLDPTRPSRAANRRISPGVAPSEQPRPSYVAFTWATSADGEILSRAAGSFATIEDARQYLGRVRVVWLDERDRWAVFKLPPESGRGALVASGTGQDLNRRNGRAAEPESTETR